VFEIEISMVRGRVVQITFFFEDADIIHVKEERVQSPETIKVSENLRTQ
jgi:hypothetical protein